jgi:hypothetical protein
MVTSKSNISPKFMEGLGIALMLIGTSIVKDWTIIQTTRLDVISCILIIGGFLLYGFSKELTTW